MNTRIRLIALLVAGLGGLPAYAGDTATIGPMIAAQGNAALQAIRAEFAHGLSRQLRDQIDLCLLEVHTQARTALAPVAGPVDVARTSDEGAASHCASRREV